MSGNSVCPRDLNEWQYPGSLYPPHCSLQVHIHHLYLPSQFRSFLPITQPPTAMNNEGSLDATVALTLFAKDFRINADVLQFALGESYDLASQNGDQVLCLQLALARLGYRFDSQTLHAKVAAFRNACGSFFTEPGMWQRHREQRILTDRELVQPN